VYSNRYEENLANFIKNARRDLGAAKDAPFVLATVGLNAQYAINTKKIHKAQIQVKEFFDNVRTVDTHDVFGEEHNYDMISRQYELIINMEVGSSMGWAMVELLKKN
jgi:menaquinone-dependent protoporphyrinogen IX oxidase